MGNCTSTKYCKYRDNKTSLNNNQIIKTNNNQIIKINDNQIIKTNDNQIIKTNDNQIIKTNDNQIIKTNESLYSVNLSDILSFDLNNSNETYISNDSNELKCQIKSSDRFYNKIIFIVKSSGSNKINKYFTKLNIIDKENNIVLGIWNNPNKTNTMGNQGICVGYHDKIYQLLFAIYHQCLECVVLNFENGIKLRVFNDKKLNNIKYELTYNKIEYINILDNDIIKKYRKIDDNSEDIDLIYKFLIDTKNI